MKVLKLENSIKTNLLLLSFLLISLFPFFISPKYNVISVKSNSDESTASPYFNFDMIRKDDSNINDWDTIIMKFDQNNNGISDQFEEKLWSNKKSINNKNLLYMREDIEVIFNKNEKNIEPIVCDQVSVIIQFPDGYDYITAISLFKDNGGIIKSTYKEIINGFAGDLNYERFILFYEQLKQNNIPFLIEENGIVKSNLYIASRNMRLRPYTWNTLGYSGDNDSSIAILDTGIDDNHEFFDNYTIGLPPNFAYKIVGWDDKVNFAGIPYDDNGHGSHCAGIAAGMGTPMDGSGKSVATAIPDLDFFGWSFFDGLSGYVPVADFNVTDPGLIEIECNFTDYTPGDDYTNGIAYLYRGDTAVNSTGSLISTTWEKNMTYMVTPSTLGKYSLRIFLFFEDNDTDGDPYVLNPLCRFRGEIHWPFNPPSFGSGNPWKGIAPKTHLVGVKVLDGNGTGDVNTEILPGIQWVFNNRKTYNITVASMSFGGPSNAATITAVNNLVEKGGIVAVVAAGNDDVGGNMIGSPGDADNAITVAAMNYNDQITSYSSQGGKSAISNTTKPDITAPGGSFYDFPIYSADTDDDAGEGLYPTDDYDHDLAPAQGTSMATPALAGAASLLITAMGGGNKWNWDNGAKAKLVKSLLLMTATETYPLRRESYGSYSPTLNRGGKDVHEGYGRINVDAAIEAWTINLTNQIISAQPISVWLNTSQYKPSGKHAYAGYVNLVKDQWYIFNLTVPSGGDYDLHLYNYTPSAWGEPVRVASSISPQKGSDEIINYTASHTGKFFLVVKAIGKAIPIAEEDDDKEKSEDEMTILEFLLSPLGLLIIGTVLAAVIIIVILARRSARKSSEKERERIKELMERSYY